MQIRKLFLLGFLCCVILPAFAEVEIVEAMPTVAHQNDNSEIVFPDTHQRVHSINPHKMNRGEGSQFNAAILLNKMAAMQDELQQMHGKMEVQSNEIHKLEQELAQTESMQAHAAPLLRSPVKQIKERVAQRQEIRRQRARLLRNSAKHADNSEKGRYKAAYTFIKQREFKKALPAMQEYLRDFPKGRYSANANYWLGELHLSRGNTQKSIHAFNKVITEYPQSSKVSAAMLKLGFAYAQIGDTKHAQEQFEKVAQKFPDTPTARLANARLKAIA